MAKPDVFVTALDALTQIRLHKEIPDVDEVVDRLVQEVEQLRAKSMRVDADEASVPEDKQSRLSDYPDRKKFRVPPDRSADPFEDRFKKAAGGGTP